MDRQAYTVMYLKHSYIVFILFVSMLVGCATNPKECDPDQAGFLTAVGGVLSGCYKDRQTLLKEEIAEEESLNQSLQQMLESIEEEKKLIDEQLRDEDARMARLNQSWLSLKAILEKKAQANQALQERIESLQGKIDRINSTPVWDKAEQKQQLDSLRNQIQLLNAELEAEVY